MDHMTSHPVLSQYEGFEHFLMCGDDKQWKLGKRRAEKDEMVGAHFMLTFQIPNEHQDLQDVEERIDSFKVFAKKMDDSVMQLTRRNGTGSQTPRRLPEGVPEIGKCLPVHQPVVPAGPSIQLGCSERRHLAHRPHLREHRGDVRRAAQIRPVSHAG